MRSASLLLLTCLSPVAFASDSGDTGLQDSGLSTANIMDYAGDQDSGLTDSGWASIYHWIGDSGLDDSGSSDWGIDSGLPYVDGGPTGSLVPTGWVDTHRWDFIGHRESHFGALGAFEADRGILYAHDASEIIVGVTDDTGACVSNAMIELFGDHNLALHAESHTDRFGCAVLDTTVPKGHHHLILRTIDGSELSSYSLNYDHWVVVGGPRAAVIDPDGDIDLDL